MKFVKGTSLFIVAVSCLACSFSLAQVDNNDLPYEDNPDDVLIDENEYEDVDDPEESLQDIRALDNEEDELEERGMRPEYEERLNMLMPYFESLVEDSINRDGRALEVAAETVSTPKKPGLKNWISDKWNLVKEAPKKFGKWVKGSRRTGRKGATTTGPGAAGSNSKV